MSRLTDLIAQVKARDPQMGLDLEAEFKALSKRRAFGLNFERHKPEEVELPGRPVRRGDKVRVLPERGTSGPGDQRLWVVTRTERVDGKRVAHLRLPVENNPEEQVVLVEDLVVVAAFGDAIYPGLVETGRVERGEADVPFHTVINAENYHALRTLTYTHRGRVDCIYIDPPYNTRDKDWKYNNHYVDSGDLYRHSKWLAFMERRLKVARELLNPEDSVLIVTIDEKEYLRLGMLLEQTFPEAKIQMVTTIIKPEGTGRKNEFSRTNEFIFFVMFGSCQLVPTHDAMVEAALDENPEDEEKGTAFEWRNLRRRERESIRGSRPSQFYAVFVDNESGLIHSISDALADDVPVDTVPVPAGCTAIYPRNKSGREMIWSIKPDTFRRLHENGFVRFNGRIVQFLQEGTVAAINRGDASITGTDEFGGVIGTFNPGEKRLMPKTLWVKASHNAQASGSLILKNLIGSRNFPFPKSLYAVEDSLRFFVSRKPTAIVLDFFAGSGTTANAVMRLNRQDGGSRQCISVTNNEVSAGEQEGLNSKGLRPGDPDWEQWGICDYITKPRIRAAIEGRTPEGSAVEGDYRFIDPFPMREGFAANARFFTLTYETPISVSHNRAYARIAPLLWLRAGAQGREISTLPEAGWEIADTYALLHDLDAEGPFLEALEGAQGLRIAYIVTDDAGRFESVSSRLPESIEPVRLYESYLTNLAFLSGD